MEHNGVFQYHTECFDQDECCSSDGLAVYLNEDDDGDEYLTGHCYSCDKFFGPKHFEDNDSKHREKRVVSKETKKLDSDLHEYIQGLDSTGSKIRKLDKKYMEMYGIKASRKESGAVHKHYYPITIKNKICGYKVRELPKKFSAVGETSPSKVQFFGQSVFESGEVIASDKFLIVTEGECFPYDAEVFTESGWVKLGEYRGGDVLQYNEDGSANFTKPTAYIMKEGTHDLVTHKVKGFTSTTTLGHNMVVQNAKGVLHKVPAQNFPVNTTGKIIRTFNIEGSGINLTDDQLRFCVAISADFKFDQRASGSVYAHAVFKKDRKKIRIREILDRCGISYTSYQQKGDRSDYTSFNVTNLPDWCPKRMLPNEWLIKATQHQRSIIMEEMVYWDGNRVPNREQVEYSSKYYENAVWMQTLAHSMGYCSSIMPRKNEFGSWYKVSVLFKKKYTSTQCISTSHEKTENGVYCVKVDSGMLVVRQNDQIHISGNCDAVATQQILSEQGNPNFINAVVSIPNGTGSAVKTVQTNWNWVQKFDHVILFFDQDEPGREAAIQVAKKLPLGKCKIAKFSEKDPCEMLKKGKEKELYDAMWRAETYAPDGVLPGESLWDMVNTPLAQSDAHYPWSGLDAMLHGIRTSEMITLTAGSGVAKSTFARTIAHHLQKTVEDNVGMIFLEESVKKTSLQIMSLEAGKQLHLPETEISDEEKRAAFDKTLGTGKYYFYDDFASQDFDGIVESIEYMARAANCKYIFLDHISMLVSGGVDGDERRALDAICTKLRSLTQQLDITLIIVTHLKRPPGVPHENGGETNLAQLRGTAGIAQLSDIVIGFERNSQADDHMERNTTHVRILKNRFSGETGLACSLLYDQQTGWLRELSQDEVAEMDTENSEFDDYDIDSEEFLHDNEQLGEKEAVVEY